MILLLLAYRSPGALALVALPIASGAVAGMAATALAFHAIHGITLAFGFTLLGVAQEYPIRVFSHRRAGTSVSESLAGVWPLLRLAIVSACIAYLAFYASGVSGLQQLASFTIVGLLVAGAATRWLLPAAMPAQFTDVASSAWLERARARLDRLPRPRWLPWAVLVLALGLLWLAPAPFWQNDLAALTPVPPALLQREGELRSALGAPDIRYLLVLDAADDEQLLMLSERIDVQVEKWKAEQLVDDVELPSRWLPSVATQRARQGKLPDRAALEAALAEAQHDLPFQPGLFTAFVDDVEKARTLPLLTPQAFMSSPLGARLQAMLARRDGRSVALATLNGVHDADKLAVAIGALRRRWRQPARPESVVGSTGGELPRAHRQGADRRAADARGGGYDRLSRRAPRLARHRADVAGDAARARRAARLRRFAVVVPSGRADAGGGTGPALRPVLRTPHRRCRRGTAHVARDADLRRLGDPRVRSAGDFDHPGAARNRADCRARRRLSFLPVHTDGEASLRDPSKESGST